MTIKLRPRTCVLALLALLLTSVPARADAVLSFSFLAVNLGENAQLFSFTFSSPYNLGPYDTLETQFSSTVSDNDGTGGAAVVPADVSGFTMIPDIDGTPIGAGSLGLGCAVAGSAGFVDATCDALSTASVAVSTLANGNFAATVAFFLSSGDSISGQGSLTLKNADVVPEPVTMALMGLGIGAVTMRRRFSR
jgi:hypothetical protein